MILCWIFTDSTSLSYTGHDKNMLIHWVVFDTVIPFTGLIPFLNYTFLVTSENEVSQFDEILIYRTAAIMTMTLEGGQSWSLRINSNIVTCAPLQGHN